MIRVWTQFKRVAVAQPDYAAVLLIHEEPHALGLGQNPRTSADITDRVRAWCSR